MPIIIIWYNCYHRKKPGMNLAHVFSCKFREILKNTYFVEHLRTPESDMYSLVLCHLSKISYKLHFVSPLFSSPSLCFLMQNIWNKFPSEFLLWTSIPWISGETGLTKRSWYKQVRVRYEYMQMAYVYMWMTYERNTSALYCVKIYITTSYGKKIYTDIQQLQRQKVKFANSEDQLILLQGWIVLYLNHSK